MKSLEVENDEKMNKVKRKIMNLEIFATCVSKRYVPTYDRRILSLKVFNGLLIVLNA